MRPTLVPVLALALALAFAGCASRSPNEATANGSGNVTAPTQGAPGFLVQDLKVSPGDGRARALHEDDTANVTYTLKNAGQGAASYLVSYILDGAVKDVETVTLDAGATKSFTQPVGPVRGLKAIDVEVRAGDQDARVHTDVTPWPRTLQDVPLGGGLSLHVNGWPVNATTGGWDVNVTLAVQPNETAPAEPHARLLCQDASGNVTATGDQLVPIPDVGNWTFATVSEPACPFTLYGMEFETPYAYARVLYGQGS
jgi:hypothetical protein